ncbi:hypothetical protein [uncultured Sphingomonas sp.]|uniref:hypothetical protein n=1 Tax=uncultured Sphingomonas sp. TaxID=158754 RepID=UPI0025DCFBB4|nr:hypothetical protein [uncultured Sphingomonas sp.]
MAELKDVPTTPAASLDKAFLEVCRSVTAKRARTVIDHILQHGIITTDELKERYGYAQPPRATRDVLENGIPLITHNVRHPTTGRRMGAYTFGNVADIKAGRLGGRKAFSKQFKKDLIAIYGERDTVTREPIAARYLQIDHRVPYQVAGDDAGPLDPADFMLLDASSNRAKSWSCEHCDNFRYTVDPAICRTCLWASPEAYTHIAQTPSRRVELVWTGDDVAVFEQVRQAAQAADVDIATYIKQRLGA